MPVGGVAVLIFCWFEQGEHVLTTVAVLRGQPLWGGGAGHFWGLEQAGSVEARTISADPTKRSMWTWQEAGAAYMFVLRDGLFAPPTSESELTRLLCLGLWSTLTIVFSRCPPRWQKSTSTPLRRRRATAAVSRAPEVNFQTFVNILGMLVKQGEEEGAGVSQRRRDYLVQELRIMAKFQRVRDDAFQLSPPEAVRRRVIFVANLDINELFGFVFDAAAPVKRQFPASAPPGGACAALSPPTFTHLHQLTSRGI